MKPFLNNTAVKTLQILNWVFFALMVFVNFLANYLPLNGKNTGELSNQYPNLFVPAPVTFAIWGVIYLLVLVFCIRQSKSIFSSTPHPDTAEMVLAVGPFFIISCLLNAFWILTWHFEYQAVSVLVMLGLLASLIAINVRLEAVAPFVSKAARFVIKAPFGVYLGWICVATVANVTAALVHFGWDGGGQSESFWACALIIIAALIADFTIIKVRNFYVGLAVVWAFVGIIIARHNAEVYQRFITWSAVFGIVLVGIVLFIEMSKAALRKQQIRPEATPLVAATEI